jgi:hypothetical protein
MNAHLPVSGWGPQGGRMSPTRIARRGSRGHSVCPSYALGLPSAIQNWSLTNLQQRLFQPGGRLIRHARYFVLQLAERH